MTTVDLFLFRHGETDWNRAHRWQGQTDIPLNELGRRQARSLISPVQTLGLDIIFSSDLVRAMETAEIVCNAIGTPLVAHPGLREHAFGDAEGLTMAQIDAKYGSVALTRSRSMLEADLDFRFPLAESKRELRDRVKTSLQALCAKYPDHTRIGVSTHGGVVRALLQSTEHVFAEPVIVANGALFHLAFERVTAATSLVAKLK